MREGIRIARFALVALVCLHVCARGYGAKLCVGDASGSGSEQYRIVVGPYRYTTSTFGVYECTNVNIAAGVKYDIKIEWVGTKPGHKFAPSGDRDYSAAVSCDCAIVNDPDGILDGYDTEGDTDYFKPADPRLTTPTLTIPGIASVTSTVVNASERSIPAPGETAELRALMAPAGRTSVWRQVGVTPIAPSYVPVHVKASYVLNGVNLHVFRNSGAGWVTFLVKDSALPDSCGKLYSFKVGCDSCDGDELPTDSECGNCGGSLCTIGTAGVGVGSADVRFALGPINYGKDHGFLRLHAQSPSTAMTTPAYLDLSFSRGSDVTMLLDSNRVARQLLCPKGCVDIVPVSDFEYRVDYYTEFPAERTNASCLAFYEPSVTNLFASYTVKNPDGAALTNRLEVVESRNGLVITNLYTFDWDADSWELEAGNGLRKESVTRTVLSGDRVMQRRQISNEYDVLAFDSVAIFGTNTGAELLLEYTVDPSGQSNTTTRTYYENPAVNAWTGLIQTVEFADGNWERYAYDDQGRLTNRVSCYKDALPTVSSSAAREVFYSYAPIDGSGDIGLERYAFYPRTVRENVLGVTVALTYTAYTTNGAGEYVRTDERCLTPSADFGDTSNLVTVTTWYGTDAGDPASGRIKTVLRPDGTRTTHEYEAGLFGAGDPPSLSAFFPDMGTDQRTTVTEGTAAAPDGIAYRTQQFVSIEDENGFLLYKETYVYTGSDYQRVDWTAYERDAFGRIVATYYPDDTQSEWSWECCGLAFSVDRNGIVSDYEYDALKRRTKTIREAGTAGATNDLTTSFTFDGAGQRITTTRSGGGLSLVSSNTYDLAGNMVLAIDAAGLESSYTYGGGDRVVTNTTSGGGTIVTERYLDGRTKSVTGTGTIAKYYDYGVDASGLTWSADYTGSQGTNSPVWVRTYTDLLGRTIRQERPGFGGTVLTNTSIYNAVGQLARATAPGRADTLYEYDALGNQIRRGLDIDGDSALDLDGPDRVSGSDRYFEADGDTNWWQVSSSVIYPAQGSADEMTNSLSKTMLTGLSTSLTSRTVSIDILGNATVADTAVDRSAKKQVRTVALPGTTVTAQDVSVNGVLVYSLGATGHTTTYAYDGLGRRIWNIQPRTGTNVTYYNAKGQVDYVEDAAGSRTSYVYEQDTGRRVETIDALSNSVYTAYDVQGRMTNTWGAVYPVAYAYDEYGRMSSMGTWRDESGSPDVTLWLYDEPTGLLTNKVYADEQGPHYTYTPDGKLETRNWARGVTTTYAYDAATGSMTNIDYSTADTTDITFAYDRLGRRTTITDAAGAWTFQYDPDTLALTNEVLVTTDGVTNALARSYDSYGRSSGVGLDSGYAISYDYDDVGRFDEAAWTIGANSYTSAYAFAENSDMVAGYDIAVGTNTFRTRKTFEPNRNLMSAVSNLWNTVEVSTYAYGNDAIGRRTNRIDSGASSATNTFGYNIRSELTAAEMGTNDYGYVYDPIGNRESYTNNAEVWTYLANELNQYTNVADGVTNSPTYDLDGNMLTYGGWAFTWNGENRLVKSESLASVPDAAKVKVENLYDYMGRRVRKTVSSDYSGGSYTTTNVTTYVWDGFNIIAEMCDAGYTNWYTYGLDLSGTLQGAGGVGGALAMTRDTGTATNTYLYCFDGNGNVVNLVDAGDSSIAATYEYSPFGSLIRSTGTIADDNPVRWSTKHTDDETGLVMYLYRAYSPTFGRFLSRDPIAERGGMNLYGYLDNSPVDRFDPFGLTYCKLHVNLNLSKAEIKTNCKKSAGQNAPYGCFVGALLHEEGAGSSGEVVKCGWFWVKRKLAVPFTMCEGTINVRKDAPSFTIAHEMRHFDNYKTWYDKYEALMDKVAGHCVCPDCLYAMIAWMKVQIKVHNLETEIADLGNDIADYPKLGPGGQQWADQAKQVLGGVKVTLSMTQQEAVQLKQKAQSACAGEKALKGIQF